MKLNLEPKPVLAICLNTAWQRTLLFDHIRHGEVNRAVEARQCGGGKGVNVVRVFRNMGWPVALAGFVGGSTGRLLWGEIEESRAMSLLVETQSETRTCTTIISRDNGEFTELIEPSGPIAPEELAALMEILRERMHEFGSVICSGSVPPGVSAAIYADIARLARQAHIPFLLDAVKQVEPTLEIGVALLKVNAVELRQIAGQESLPEAAAALLQSHTRLQAIAVTDGAAPAWLFTRDASYCLRLPDLKQVVSAIGGGDCTAAILGRRLAEGLSDSELPAAFAEALACASASCLTEIPSVFDTPCAQDILAQITVTRHA